MSDEHIEIRERLKQIGVQFCGCGAHVTKRLNRGRRFNPVFDESWYGFVFNDWFRNDVGGVDKDRWKD